MTTETASPQATQKLGKRSGLLTHLFNIYRLVWKELRSIRADPMMLILVAYTFSLAVYTVATGASTEAKDLTVGVVDEDRSDLSRSLLTALNPPLFKRSVVIAADEISRAFENVVQYRTSASGWSAFMCATIPAADGPRGSGSAACHSAVGTHDMRP